MRGGGRIFRGDHQIFGRTKVKSVVTENVKGGIAENFGRIQRVITQFCLKNEDRGRGGDCESHQKSLGGITSVK